LRRYEESISYEREKESEGDRCGISGLGRCLVRAYISTRYIPKLAHFAVSPARSCLRMTCASAAIRSSFLRHSRPIYDGVTERAEP
jgi:hypothetical protein